MESKTIDNYAYKRFKVNPDTIRKDILSHGNFMFPEEFIRNLDQSMFQTFSIGKYYLVHISYRNSDTRSTEPVSAVAIYILKNNKWIYQDQVTYYYEMKLLNDQRMLFVSDNLFCYMNGECSSYFEISQFDGKKMLPLIHYVGFDNKVYYDGLLVYGKIKEVKKALGDTITNLVRLTNFVFNDKSLKSYSLQREIAILKDVKDTLITKEIRKTIEVNLKE